MVSLRSLALVAFASLGLMACDRASTVALELTDAPIDTSTINKVEVSFGKVEILQSQGCPGMDDDSTAKPTGMHGSHHGGGDQWVAVSDNLGSIDLLSLQNGTTKALGEAELYGNIGGIRLQIDSSGTNQVTLSDGNTCALDTSAVTEASLELGDAAAIEPERGGRTTIVVDFLVKDSITEVSSCRFALSPVLEIKSVTHEEDAE